MSSLKEIGTGCIGAPLGVIVGAAVVSSAGAVFGAVTGEILDWIPYLNTAIPEGFAYIGNSFSDGDNTQQVRNYLVGNLDKVGAAMGFLGGFVRSSATYKPCKTSTLEIQDTPTPKNPRRY